VRSRNIIQRRTLLPLHAEYAKRGITLSPSMWLVKMMCGAIDPSYDEADEGA
jgi:hypothetical protein